MFVSLFGTRGFAAASLRFGSRARTAGSLLGRPSSTLHGMLHPVLVEAFDTLLMTWRLCDDLAKSEAPYHKRLESRFKLDAARNRLGRYRRALNPEQRELEEVAFTTHCPSLDATVFVSHFEKALQGAGSTYACVCGAEVEIPRAGERHARLADPSTSR